MDLEDGASTFTIEREGAVVHVAIARPQAANAIPLDGWRALSQSVGAHVGNGARVLILRSTTPRFFSAGADIEGLATLAEDRPARSRFREEMRAALTALGALPSIALVEGGCYGAGVALALACDVRYATPGARFGITPARLGISYPQEDVTRLVALVGPGQASRLLLSGDTIDADEGARIGLVDHVSDDAAVQAEAWATAVASHGPTSVAELRRAIRGESSAQGFDAAFGTDAFLEGLARFRGRVRIP